MFTKEQKKWKVIEFGRSTRFWNVKRIYVVLTDKTTDFGALIILLCMEIVLGKDLKNERAYSVNFLVSARKNCGLLLLPTVIFINIITNMMEQYYIVHKIASHFWRKVQWENNQQEYDSSMAILRALIWVLFNFGYGDRHMYQVVYERKILNSTIRKVSIEKSYG